MREPVSLGDRADVAEGLAERVRVQGDDPRAGWQIVSATARTSSMLTAQTGHSSWVTMRSGSSVAQALRVELVDRLAALGALAHGGVDLAGAQARRAARRA